MSSLRTVQNLQRRPTATPRRTPKPVSIQPPDAVESHDAESRQSYTLASGDAQRRIALTVADGEPQLKFNLSRGTNDLSKGHWDWQLTVQGRQISSDDSWTNICSETNDESEYAEFQLDLEDGFQIERQVFLARQDRFIFLADVLKAPSATTGEYRTLLPLGNNSLWKPAAETWDGQLLHHRRIVASVVPVCLPEWRGERDGSLGTTDRQLELKLPLRGQRLHAGLFLDLDSDRSRRPLTWRRLTVGESLQSVPGDVAVGYRIQVGKSQWLIYRSLGTRGNRTVLGQNFSSEFVVARFRPDGTAEKLLEIE